MALMPTTKTGVEMPRSATNMHARSTQVSFISAARMPMESPRVTASRNAAAASCTVLRKYSRMRSRTGTPSFIETPKSRNGIPLT
jgi:hypothetical protein